ncbi:hypothetical protein PM082_020599 [Marasmius tenuissimus]|nr:hypothetical protein PM082_020599 [Marasmius tenuissimus]
MDRSTKPTRYPMFLPPEILFSIFQGLPKSDLRTLALVCPSWVPASRSHAFNHLQLDLNLNKPVSALQFLELCESPLETITTSGVRTLVITHYDHHAEWTSRQQTLALEKLWSWRSSDGRRSLSTMLSDVRCLHLHHLSLDASVRLPSEIFGSIKELHLYYTRFDTYSAFLSVLQAVGTPESLEMTGCIGPIGSGRADAAQREEISVCKSRELACRSTLHTISLHSVKDAQLVGLLVPSPALQTLRVALQSLPSLHDDLVVAEVRKLMVSARSSLNNIRLDLTNSICIRNFVSSLENDPLAGYPRLRELELRIAPHELLSFLDGISGRGVSRPSTAPSPLTTLKIPSLYSRRSSSDWGSLDEILQRPYFSSLERLVPNFYIMFRSTDATKQPKALSYASPDECSPIRVMLRLDIIRLEEHLPKCSKRGIVVPRVEYSFIPDPVTPRPTGPQPARAMTKFEKLKALVKRVLLR